MRETWESTEPGLKMSLVRLKKKGQNAVADQETGENGGGSI